MGSSEKAPPAPQVWGEETTETVHVSPGLFAPVQSKTQTVELPPPKLGGPGGPLCVLLQQEADALDLPLPSYATSGAAGMDVRAAVDSDVVLLPGARLLVSTGVRIALPDGYEAQIRPRSGLALQHGVTLLNSPGTIDSDYRGVIGVILINLGQEPFTVKRGDRIAQMVVAPVARVHWETVDSLPVSVRNNGGFGHTGVNDGVGD